MINETLENLKVKVWHEVSLPDGHRIVDTWPIDEKHWKSEEECNRNVYRLDASNNVVWKIKRAGESINWNEAHKAARILGRGECWYEDPFAHMGCLFFKEQMVQDGSFKTTEYIPCGNYIPGAVLPISTYEMNYYLDPETGIATFTGEYLK